MIYSNETFQQAQEVCGCLHLRPHPSDSNGRKGHPQKDEALEYVDGASTLCDVIWQEIPIIADTRCVVLADIEGIAGGVGGDEHRCPLLGMSYTMKVVLEQLAKPLAKAA